MIFVCLFLVSVAVTAVFVGIDTILDIFDYLDDKKMEGDLHE